MLFRHDIEILKFIADKNERLFSSETPFTSSELENLAQKGYLIKSTKMIYGAPGDHPDSFPCYSIAPLGKTAIIEYTEDKEAEARQEKRNNMIYIFSAISAIAAVLSVLLTLLN